jgi:hypothetical protein
MSTAKLIYNNLPVVTVVKNKAGEDCLLLPIVANFIFKNDKGEYSQSFWVNSAKMPLATHTAKIRTPKDANIDHLKTVVGEKGNYLPTAMYINIEGEKGTETEVVTQVVISSDEMPF